MKKEILIVQPSFYLHNKKKFVKRLNRFCLLPSLISPYLASFFSKDIYNITIQDEVIHRIDFKKKYDLVAIPFVTPQTKRAYEIADNFRHKGSNVLLGGYHVSACPEEAKLHADAIVVGEFEPVASDLIIDFSLGRLKKSYFAGSSFDMNNMNFPRYDLIDWKKFSTPTHSKFPIETSRGCHLSCDFCCIDIIHGKKMRFRPTEDILMHIDKVKADYKSLKPRFVFVDENMVAFGDRNVDLLTQLVSRKIQWSSFFSVDVCNRPDFISLAAKSGCVGAVIGFESIDEANMDLVNKRTNRCENYFKVANLFKKHNIPIYGTIMVGFPKDNQVTLEKTVHFLNKIKIHSSFFYPVYPFPGTRMFEKFKKENILIKDNFWLDVHNPYTLIKFSNFANSKMNFEESFKRMLKLYFSFKSILIRSIASKRLFRTLMENLGLKFLNWKYDAFSTL